MASESEAQPWTVAADARLLGLEIQLLHSAYALPWTQFLYATGTSEQVRAVFTTHDVVVKGSGLASLLSDFAAQRIAVLKEPARTDRFAPATCPRITELTVHAVAETRSSD